MSKVIPIALAAHYATRDTTLAYGLKITRQTWNGSAYADGDVYAYTSHDIDDTVDSILYRANPGLSVTDIVVAANSAVGNMEMTVLHDGVDFTVKDVLNGLWRNAKFLIFRYNFESIADGRDDLLAGTLGEAQMMRGAVVVELRDLRQYFQQPVGSASSKTCRYRLGDSRCGLDLTPFTHTGTLTGVTSNQVFRDSSRGEAADYFGAGEIEMTSGANEGARRLIREYAADGTFTLAQAFAGTVGIGDTYTAIAGDRKRLEEDCRDKFSNVLRFGGEPHRPGLNDLATPAEASV